MSWKKGERPARRGAGARVFMLTSLAALAAASCSERGPGSSNRPNVVMWMVDTLRADRLSCYGYARPTTPVMDSLAAGGVLFENVHAHTNWTQPSVASILTGCYAPPFSGDFTTSMPEGMVTAAEWLRGHGYRTAGMTLTIATAASFGFGQGYDEYHELDAGVSEEERAKRAAPLFAAETLVDKAIEWLAGRRGRSEAPFFLYLHTLDPHQPLSRHPGYPDFTGPYDGPMDGSIERIAEAIEDKRGFTTEDTQHLLDLYDGEVAYNDAQLGRLVQALEATGLGERTLLVVMSDHGEELFERRTIGHGHMNVHGELTRVPLILSWKDHLPAGRRVGRLLGAIDIVPTLLDLMGMPPLPDADGRSAAEAIDAAGGGTVDGAPSDSAPVFIDRGKARFDLVGVRTASFLFLFNRNREWLQKTGCEPVGLFDLTQDPYELNNVQAQEPGQVSSLQRVVNQWALRRQRRFESYGESRAVDMDEATRRALEQLGYVK